MTGKLKCFLLKLPELLAYRPTFISLLLFSLAGNAKINMKLDLFPKIMYENIAKH